MRLIIFALFVLLVSCSVQAPVESAANNSETQLTPSVACPRQMVDCASPGICAAYTDKNADQLCDASQKP
jgi:hypothetical protein